MASSSAKVESVGKKALRYTGYIASFGIAYIVHQVKKKKQKKSAILVKQASVESIFDEDWITTENLMFKSTSDGATAAQHEDLVQQKQDDAMSIISWVIEDVPNLSSSSSALHSYPFKTSDLKSSFDMHNSSGQQDDAMSVISWVIEDVPYLSISSSALHSDPLKTSDFKIFNEDSWINTEHLVLNTANDGSAATQYQNFQQDDAMPISSWVINDVPHFQLQDEKEDSQEQENMLVPDVKLLPLEASFPQKILKLVEENETQRQKIQELEEMISSKDDRLNRLISEMTKLQDESDLEAFSQSRERNCHQRQIIDYEDRIRDLQDKIALYDIACSYNEYFMDVLVKEFIKLQDAHDRLEQEAKLSSFLTIDKGTVIDIPQYSSFASMQIEYKRIQFLDKSGFCIKADAGQE